MSSFAFSRLLSWCIFFRIRHQVFLFAWVGCIFLAMSLTTFVFCAYRRSHVYPCFFFSHPLRCQLYFSLNRALFPKIDIDNDSQVSMTELYGWIEQHMKKHVLHGTDARMRELDTNKDGKLSWEEYRVVEFPPQLEEGWKQVSLWAISIWYNAKKLRAMENQLSCNYHLIGLTDPILTELREIIMRDKRRFEFSDTDSDNMLSQEELTFFLHPEESKRMASYLVKVCITWHADVAGRERSQSSRGPMHKFVLSSIYAGTISLNLHQTKKIHFRWKYWKQWKGTFHTRIVYLGSRFHGYCLVRLNLNNEISVL